MNAGSKRFQHVASSKSPENAETASNSRTKGSARFKPKALVVAMSVSGFTLRLSRRGFRRVDGYLQ